MSPLKKLTFPVTLSLSTIVSSCAGSDPISIFVGSVAKEEFRKAFEDDGSNELNELDRRFSNAFRAKLAEYGDVNGDGGISREELDGFRKKVIESYGGYIKDRVVRYRGPNSDFIDVEVAYPTIVEWFENYNE